MARDVLNIDTSFASALRPENLDLMDLEAVRLLLDGTSVIDWHRLELGDRKQVDRFLRVSGLEMDDPRDRERLRFVFNQAINYLEEHHSVRFPPDLRDPEDIREIFITASTRAEGMGRRQSLACIILKLMHTINHMEAADLKHRAAISEAELFDRAERAIIAHADELRRQGYPLQAFYGSRKTRTSVISKLLSKRESIAATIFDKLRFRIAVREKEELLPVLAHLTRTLFPVNYVIPGESHNNLIHLSRMLSKEPHYQELAKGLQRLAGPQGRLLPDNPFSGAGYRVVNWIVDFPVRIDDVIQQMDLENTWMLGRLVYVMVEFQVADEQTAEHNEIGDNDHRLYKARQQKVVESRLRKGSRRDD